MIRRYLWLLGLLFAAQVMCAAPALASTTVIDQPTAAYLAGTNKFDLSGVTNDTTVTSISDSLNQVFFDRSLVKVQVPVGWSTWSSPPYSESATPAVLTGVGLTSLNIQLAQPVKEFGFEMEPQDFDVATETVTFRIWMGGTIVRTVTKAVDGDAGARLMAILSSTAFSRVEISAPSGGGFAIAQLRYALGTNVSKPTVSPSRPRRGRTARFRAYLTPSAAATGGSATVSLYRWEKKRVRGRTVHYWRLKKTVATAFGSGGRITASTKLSARGRWKAVVRFAGSRGYVASASAAKVFTVR